MSLESGIEALQNGSDVRGVAMEGVIGERVTLSSERVRLIGLAFVTWLRGQSEGRPINGAAVGRKLRIAIGHDCRLTSPDFAAALQEAFLEAGCDALQCGLSTTPAMLQSTLLDEVAADGAVMVTGSHMPFNNNGLKFFSHGREIDRDELSVILSYTRDPYRPAEVPGQEHVCNLLSLYSLRLRAEVERRLGDFAKDSARPLSCLHVVVDAGNGVGSFFVRRVLEPLGCNTQGSQFLVPDGRFPNHSANPEDYEALRSLSQRVVEQGADIGILFDSDCDRVGFVGNHGRTITRNEFVAMAARLALEEHPGSTIVTDSITSTGLTEFIQKELGGHHCRYQRGYRNVIAEAERLNREGTACWLAAETSGHAAFRENHFSDDGVWFAVKVLERLAHLKREGKEIYSLVEKLPHPESRGEWRLRLLGSDYGRSATETMSGLRQYVAQMPGWEEVNQNYDGLRVVCSNADEQGWFLLRLSLHNAEMPLNVESDLPGGVVAIIAKLKRFFRNVRTIDSTPIYQAQ